VSASLLRRTWKRVVVRSALRRRRVRRYVHSKLAWNRLYRATSYLKSALWTAPLVAILLVLVAAPFVRRLDAWLDWKIVAIGESGLAAMYQTVITLTLSFLVFTFGSLLVAIQVASGQLTPRIIATTLLRNNVVRFSVGLFVFTLMVAVIALNRSGTETAAPQLVALITATLGVACIANFLFLIDYAARLLRPVSVVASVGNDGAEAIRSVYPARSGDLVAVAAPLRAQLGAPTRTITHAGASGTVLAVDLATIVALARRHAGVVELLPQVGDFVATDEPLFALYGGAARIDERALRATVAFGAERTIEQDPMFAFRILVDIALKALSPAINDPTTAVIAIDQVHRLMRVLGKRQLRGEIACDDTGEPRMIFRTPNWEDYVHLACHEIRMCGADNAQIARRLRAMLENLQASLPATRGASLAVELSLLDRAIDTSYAYPEDRALARIPDSQGLGGSLRPNRSRAAP